MRNAWHTFQLGLKEIVSLARDPVLLFLIAYDSLPFPSGVADGG